MKKILITGSSGYIGRHLCKILKDDYHVTGLDRQYLPQDCDEFIQHNILGDVGEVVFSRGGYDVVVHLAALVNVGESVRVPVAYYENNITGTLRMLENLNFKHFIFASTGAAHNPTSPYGTSKRLAEGLVNEYCTLKEKKHTIFRFYNVIGSDGIEPTNMDGLMYNLMKAKDTGEFNLFGTDYDTKDGTAIRDYLHVYEVCQAIKFAIEKPYSDSMIENLGHGKGYSVLEMVNIFKEVNNCDFKVNLLPRRPGDLPISVLEDVSPYMQSRVTIKEMLKL
jgi:UDP-glucose 4-epimerase